MTSAPDWWIFVSENPVLLSDILRTEWGSEGFVNALLPPDAFRLPAGRPGTHKIYCDIPHHSRLVLPFTTSTMEENR